jgi:GxxExxY protein
LPESSIELRDAANNRDPLSRRVIGLAIDVHRALGPGLLESVYEECLCLELRQSGLPYKRQLALPVVYKNITLKVGYRIDIVVQDALVIEVKTVERLLPIHEAQLLTYLKLSGLRTGLLLNFQAMTLREGIKRLVV